MRIGEPRFSRQFLLWRLMLSRRRERRAIRLPKHGPSVRGMTMLGSVVRSSQSAEGPAEPGRHCRAWRANGRPRDLQKDTRHASMFDWTIPAGHRVETRSRLGSNAPKFMAPISGIQSLNFPQSDHGPSNGSGATAAFDQKSPLRVASAVPVARLVGAAVHQSRLPRGI
jgi:hypothetical protein